MREYELTFITNPINDDLLETLLEGGDAFVSCQSGLTRVIVDMTASTFSEAAFSGARLLANAGVFVIRLDHDLVNQAEIAARADVTPARVTQWVQERKQPNGFPLPYTIIRNPVWAWGEVLEWLQSTSRNLDDPLTPRPSEVDEFNANWAKVRPWMYTQRRSRSEQWPTLKSDAVGWVIPAGAFEGTATHGGAV